MRLERSYGEDLGAQSRAIRALLAWSPEDGPTGEVPALGGSGSPIMSDLESQRFRAAEQDHEIMATVRNELGRDDETFGK
jgi:hypothetical protein